METAHLKKFAQEARRSLIEQVKGKLGVVLAQDSPARRESPEAVKKLESAISKSSKDQVIEQVAYTWFNRFCALRYMDANRYTRVGVVSPGEGQTQPEILAEAKMGHIDEVMVPESTRTKVKGFLSNTLPSSDPQAEAYRLLVVAACNHWHEAMPFLFEKIDDFTELLMPDDLLSTHSILTATREAMSPEVCKDVEVIGWLYQFYISEKKDKVFEGLKKNKKITPENIPAATQLFTPHWIVRYLVENSLGRLWLLNRPESKIFKNMKDRGEDCYYFGPEESEADFLKVNSPEDIKICDPACGSGHMLTYAFDLLYAIYEEEGYEPTEIPEKILTKNLFGVEIDERAGELAAFALTMKSREKHKRFFSKGIKPNICVLENVEFTDGELKEYMDFVGRELFTASLQTTLHQFEEAKNFGSLIRPDLTGVSEVVTGLEEKDVSGDLIISTTHKKVLKVVKQADYLSPKYHVVIANPPYMGGKGMNPRLGSWLKEQYSDVKSDLFSAFIVRNTELALQKGQLGFMTPFVWMFISSYEKLRNFLVGEKTITSLVQLEYSGFEGATVPICTFTIENEHKPKFKGSYVRLSEFRGSENQGPRTLEAIKNRECGWFYSASATEITVIPGMPIAYWVGENTRLAFANYNPLSDYAFSDGKNITGDNDKYQRFFWEVSSGNVGAEARWAFISKGGGYKKWFENKDVTIDWSESARTHYRKNKIGRIIPEYIRFRKGITWGLITSSLPSFRLLSEQHTFSDVGLFFEDEKNIPSTLAFLNSKVAYYFLNLLNPTLNYPMEMVLKLPISNIIQNRLGCDVVEEISDLDQDGILNEETSWDFVGSPLLRSGHSRDLLMKENYIELRSVWHKIANRLMGIEEKNNAAFVDAFGLQDEVDSDVLLKHITLNCNPHYRYGGDKAEEELEALLLADTMRELISYGVGCMFGRYSLDRPGLILANQDETIEDYKRLVPDSKFPADDDNVIPILDGDWFIDDIADRFREFIKVAFGEEHYEENIKFIEDAIGKSIRDYFLKEFYTDHVKRYKKRPIYWMFSSPQGSFNALIYMHRYRPDTVSVVLNDYLREFRTKLTAHQKDLEATSVSSSASQRDKTKALKDLESVKKMILELEDYEREVLYPLATEQVEIDLDDGVKLNYPKFGAALKKITGLS